MKTLLSFKSGSVRIMLCKCSSSELFTYSGVLYCLIEQYGTGDERKENIYNFAFSSDANKLFLQLVNFWVS